jgi:hypothetical protein
VTELNLNRARLGLLRAIRAGHVYRNDEGMVFRKVDRTKFRIDAKVRELQEHGLVDEQLQLTDAGAAAAA